MAQTSRSPKKSDRKAAKPAPVKKTAVATAVDEAASATAAAVAAVTQAVAASVVAAAEAAAASVAAAARVAAGNTTDEVARLKSIIRGLEDEIRRLKGAPRMAGRLAAFNEGLRLDAVAMAAPMGEEGVDVLRTEPPDLGSPEALRASGLASPGLWRRFVKLCLISLQNDERMLDPVAGRYDLTDAGSLKEYVMAQEGEFRLLALHDGAYAALAAAASGLAENHAKAAAVVVDTILPTSPTAVSIVADLRALSEAIKGDQNLGAALSLTVALVEAATKAYGG